MALHPKVRSAAQVGAVVSAIIGVAAAAGFVLPAAVAAALVTLATFIAGYFTSSPAA